jgi:serine/threonine protein kinase/Tfp pilus assembly protein PilF
MTADLASPRQDSGRARALASEIIARHASDLVLDAESILRANPDLRQFPSIVVDLAYEEFCRRLDAGEPMEAEEFARRFPAVTTPLLKLLEVHAYLDQHPDAFANAPEVEWPEAGADVAGFRLDREIGQGGFSRVFLAREKDLGDRQVVLKVCIRANQEAARLGQLIHPHIVPVHSVQFASYPPFTLICMPFLGTTTMSDVVEQVFLKSGTQPRSADLMKVIELLRRQTSSPPPEPGPAVSRSSPTWHRRTYADFILLKGSELCEALAYAHRLKVWHCDVKPSNVLLTNDGRALLLDFNLAVRDDDDAGVMGGTLPYMAPEQLQHLENNDQSVPPVDHRTDLFALGVTMFQLLTGRLPYPTEHLPQNRIEAARQLLELQRVQRDWRSELKGAVSPQAARVIGDCLAFDPQKRPDSAAGVAQQFRRELATAARIRRWIRSRRWSLSIATALLLVIASIFGIAMSYQAPAHLRHYQLGVDYLEAVDFNRARQCFDQALEIRNDFREALIMRGWTDLLAARGEEDERAELQRSAKDLFREASDRYGCAESAASLGQYYAETGDHFDARTGFQNALDRGFSTASIANNLGFSFLRTDQDELAAAHLNEALRLDPSLVEAHRNLLVVRCRLAQQSMQSARRARNDETAWQQQIVAETQLRMAWDQLEVMRLFAPQTAELELLAAQVLALVVRSGMSTSNENPEQQERDCLKKLLAACETAIELNLDPRKLQHLEGFAPQLKEDARFQRLLGSVPPRIPAEPTRALADIFPEIKSRMTSTKNSSDSPG